VIVLDAEGTLLHANQTLLDFYGRTLEEIQGAGPLREWKRDVHPDDFERVHRERKIGFSKGTSFEIEKTPARQRGALSLVFVSLQAPAE